MKERDGLIQKMGQCQKKKSILHKHVLVLSVVYINKRQLLIKCEALKKKKKLYLQSL